MWRNVSSHLPDRDRLGMLVGVILLGLALTQFVRLPGRQLGTTVLGSALNVDISGYWMLIGVLVILAGAGTEMLIRSHPRLSDDRLRVTLIAWILPGLTVLTAGGMLQTIPNWPMWWAGLLLTGVLFSAVVTAEYALVDEGQPASSRARLLLNIMAYLLVLILYAAIYRTRSRSLITATVVLLISFLVALDLLWTARAGLGRTALLAGLIGLILAECSWAINYWRAGVMTASLTLLLTFYTASGLATQYLLGKLSRQVLIEFAVVAAVGSGLLMVFHP